MWFSEKQYAMETVFVDHFLKQTSCLLTVEHPENVKYVGERL